MSKKHWVEIEWVPDKEAYFVAMFFFGKLFYDPVLEAPPMLLGNTPEEIYLHLENFRKACDRARLGKDGLLFFEEELKNA